MKRKLAALAAISLASFGLAACTSGSDDIAGQNTDPGEKGFDVSSIKADPEIQKLVPQNIKDAGVLKNGASTDYAPAEFKKEDGQTPTGYDVDMVKAIAKVMGLKEGTTPTPSLIPSYLKSEANSISAFLLSPSRKNAKPRQT